jgi:hypothetical protein
MVKYNPWGKSSEIVLHVFYYLLFYWPTLGTFHVYFNCKYSPAERDDHKLNFLGSTQLPLLLQCINKSANPCSPLLAKRFPTSTTTMWLMSIMIFLQLLSASSFYKRQASILYTQMCDGLDHVFPWHQPPLLLHTLIFGVDEF